jgi:hypothetical protein
MACPLFIPSSPLGELFSVAAPLGDLYGGQCAAEPAAVIEPETLRRYCNFGYARGCCPRAAQSDSDAARFMIRGARGSIVDVAWAVERNHHPVAVGRMEIETADPAPASDLLARQAHACASAYARQAHGAQEYPGRIAAVAHP